MPLYEYECSACHHHFEKIESFSAPDEKECPKCGAKARRVLTAPAIQFKGSGWYVTDYGRKDSGGGVASASGDKPSGSSPGAEKKTAEKTAPEKKN